MLLKVERLVQAKWVVTPGRSQVRGGFSRNPEGRDAARNSSSGLYGMPKTLEEALQVATEFKLDGFLLTNVNKILK